MTKQQIMISKRCGKFSLRLIGKQQTYYKGTVIVDFKPISKNKNKQHLSIMPTFNKDKKHYTPAFYLPNTQKQHEQCMKQDHQKRVIQSEAEISQIFVSKPRSKQKYCGVCRNNYEDYLQHTQSQKHMQKLKNSCFQKYLIEESQKFKSIIEKQSQVQFQKGNTDSCQTIIQPYFEFIQQYFNLG